MPKSSSGTAAGACARVPGAPSGCAAVTRLLGGDPAGTAGYMTSWLLVEQPGAWAEDALETTMASVFPTARLDAARAAGLRPLLIRRPGKHARADGTSRAVFVAGGRPGNRWVERFDVTSLGELAHLDLTAIAAGRRGHGRAVPGPMFLVCTHGSKDMCCAVLGRPVAAGLAQNHPGRVWEVSHVGGDRWAGNLLTVPDGFMHGRLGAAEAALVAKDALAGDVHLENLRGRTSAKSRWAQVAEIAVRGHTGLRGLDAVLAVEDGTGDPGNGESGTVLVTAGEQHYAVALHRVPAAGAGASRCAPHLVLSGYVIESIRPVSPRSFGHPPRTR